MSAGEPPASRTVRKLKAWPEIAGFPDSPPAIRKACAAFDSGLAAHARGDAAEAQAQFLRAAALVPAAQAPYSSSFDELRRIARENAATAAAGPPPPSVGAPHPGDP